MKLLDMEVKTTVSYPTAWLYAMADNLVKDTLKRTHPEEALSDLLASPFDLDKTILNADMKEALSKLEPITQQIIYLHAWEGYSYKELAVKFRLSYANVRIKASRGYKVVKKYL